MVGAKNASNTHSEHIDLAMSIFFKTHLRQSRNQIIVRGLYPWTRSTHTREWSEEWQICPRISVSPPGDLTMKWWFTIVFVKRFHYETMNVILSTSMLYYFRALMAQSDLIEKLVSCIDCKQGAVRAVRFNGKWIFIFIGISTLMIILLVY